MEFATSSAESPSQNEVTYYGDFEHPLTRHCDVYSSVSVDGNITSAELVAGDSTPVPVRIRFNVTETGASRFAYPESPFPIFLTPYQIIKLVVKATGPVTVKYTGKYLSRTTKETLFRCGAVLSWGDEKFEFVNGVVQKYRG
jgi:hypothetical protein